jgi:hypothetical protein
VYHAKLLDSVGAEALRHGRIPKKHILKDATLRLVDEPTTEPDPTTTVVGADPASVRPSLARAAAENVEALKDSLLEAAAAATKPVWITVECSGCGERSRIEAPIADTRTRIAAIELLLREGLGRTPQAEEAPRPSMPNTVEQVQAMSWEQMQYVFAACYAEEIGAVLREGGEALLCERLSRLSEDERRLLQQALAGQAA